MREDQRSTMERDASFSSDPTSTRRHHHPVLPPWEVRSVSQVPFIEPGSPPLARRDDQGFFAMGSTPRTNHRPKLSATISAPCASEYSSPVEQNSSYPWKDAAPVPHAQVPSQSSYETPASREPTQYRPPYEDPHSSKPVFRKAASQPPPTFVPQAPPTPLIVCPGARSAQHLHRLLYVLLQRPYQAQCPAVQPATGRPLTIRTNPYPVSLVRTEQSTMMPSKTRLDSESVSRAPSATSSRRTQSTTASSNAFQIATGLMNTRPFAAYPRSSSPSKSSRRQGVSPSQCLSCEKVFGSTCHTHISTLRPY